MLHVVAISSGSCLIYFLFVGLNLLNAVRGVKEIYVGELKWKEERIPGFSVETWSVPVTVVRAKP